jgi:hypothetical protein
VLLTLALQLGDKLFALGLLLLGRLVRLCVLKRVGDEGGYGRVRGLPGLKGGVLRRPGELGCDGGCFELFGGGVVVGVGFVVGVGLLGEEEPVAVGALVGEEEMGLLAVLGKEVGAQLVGLGRVGLRGHGVVGWLGRRSGGERWEGRPWGC